MSEQNKPYTTPGPIFEPGPGWGGRLKKWSKKYILGWDCTLCRTTRYVLVFGVLVLVVAWPKFHAPKPPVPEENKITETVELNDGKTQLARKILAKYLDQNTNLNPSKAQKVFMETVLREKIPDEATKKIGNEVGLGESEIEQVINLSNLLSPLQLKKWESYAQRVSF